MLWRMLLSAFDSCPDRVLFSEGDVDLRVGDLVGRAAALGSRLVSEGIGPGETVGVLARQGLRAVTALWGVLGSGGIAAPLNPSSRQGEVARALTPCRPRLVLCEPDLVGLLEPIFPHVVSLDEALSGSGRGDSIPTPSFDPDRGAFFLFSTGSTGFPKRVLRTHRMMRAESDQYQAGVNLGPDDLILGIPPIYHSFGLCCVMLSAIRSGARARLFAEFQPETVLAAATNDRATVMPGSPFHYSILTRMTARSGVDLSSLRWPLSCGAPPTARIVDRFHERFGLRVRQLYGASEAGSVTLDGAVESRADSLSVGTPLPGVSVRIVGEDGIDLPDGEVGELAVSSPAVARRYEDLPEISARVFRAGWFHSGDLGWRDGSGRIRVTGRTKLLINAGGNKVDPIEVEGVLQEHAAVSEAAVVGVPAAHGLEVVKAIVVLSPGGQVDATAEELRAHCAERLIGYKVPRIVEFRDALPRSPSGKLLRSDLMREAE